MTKAFENDAPEKLIYLWIHTAYRWPFERFNSAYRWPSIRPIGDQITFI